ncbi:hypothetical protein [Desulfobulbus oralis]|uniref:Lipoprotein n=1 Tax=Desulfobulbus oralis TaxID=1986146 RepID=A0A2L1GNU9_9BACT|nr:hypothetical protein [Desulfobulbus oralis]AVD71297.1 hypothetical protein CAY53_07285 [Desulfobulbus oralis]
MNRKNLGFLLCLTLACILLTATACTRGYRQGPNTVAGSMEGAGLEGGALPQVNSFANDINDIPIPSELKWQRGDSMAITTESFRGGVLTYTGNASMTSLRDYMVAAMRDNQWRMVGETAAKDTMLAFVKPNKTCMVIISESWLKRSEVKLYIAIDNAASGNVNPFGEAIPQ